MAKKVLSSRDEARLGKMLKWYERQSPPGDAPPSVGSRGLGMPTITVLNDTSETIPPYSIVELKEGDVIGDTIPYCKASKPTSSVGKLYGVTDGASIENGKYGQCFIYGSVRFTYDTGTPELGKMYGASNGAFAATLGGVKSLVMCLGIIDSDAKIASGFIVPALSAIYGKLSAQLTAATPTGATVRIYTGVAPGSDSGEDWTNVCCDGTWIGSGKKIAADSMVFCVQAQDGTKFILASPCPVTA